MYTLGECGVRAPNSSIHRFDGDYWTINKSSPAAMGTVNAVNYEVGDLNTTRLNVRCSFTSNVDNIGLTWNSVDELGHGAMKYSTNLNYAGDSLSFFVPFLNADGEETWRDVYDWVFVITYSNNQVEYVPVQRYIKPGLAINGIDIIMPLNDMWTVSVTGQTKISGSGIASIAIRMIPHNSGLGNYASLKFFTTNEFGRCQTMGFDSMDIDFYVGDVLNYLGTTDTITAILPDGIEGEKIVQFDTTNPVGFYPNQTWVGKRPILEPVNASAIPREDILYSISIVKEHPDHSVLTRWKPNPGDAEPEKLELQMTGDFDDMYRMTPARIVEEKWRLGYTGTFILSLGAANYQEIEGDNVPLTWEFFNMIDRGALQRINKPCEHWLKGFVVELERRGFTKLVFSLSYKILGEYIIHDGSFVDQWVQRDTFGAPAFTDVTQQTTLITPGSSGGIGYLAEVMEEGVSYLNTVAVQIAAQLQDPMWWYNVHSDYNLCMYDQATVDRYFIETGLIPPLPHLEDIRDVTQDDLVPNEHFIGWLSDRLGASVHEIMELMLVIHPGTETSLFMQSIEIVAPPYPVYGLLNWPDSDYEFPNFSYFHLYDYPWVLDAAFDFVPITFTVFDLLGYSRATSFYSSGLILDYIDRWKWWRLDHAIDIAKENGMVEIFVSGSTQVDRDALVWFGFGEDETRGFACGAGTCSI